jgi:hypothetical protein
MRNYLLISRGLLGAVLVLLGSLRASAQEQKVDSTTANLPAENIKTTAAAAKNTLRTAASLKSGTSQDVLTSFFKLGYADIRDGHEFKFNSSLFAVRAKTDSTLWIDTAYSHQVFARNFTFGFTYGADTDYKFKSGSLDLRYALINKRDKDLFSFGPSYVVIGFMRTNKRLLDSAANIYFTRHRDRVLTEGKLIGNFYAFTKDAENRTPIDKIPAEYLQILDALKKLPQFQAAKDPLHFRDSLKTMYAALAELMAKRPLWTIGCRLFTSSSNVISKANFNTEYLKGMTNPRGSMGVELDLKANWNIYDSTVVKTLHHRNTFAASAGINWIIYKNPDTQKSYVEFKPSLSYERTFSGKYDGEKEGGFAGDGVLRFRITDDLWLPIEIKYDRASGKVLGFLNITTNFDWLGGKKN